MKFREFSGIYFFFPKAIPTLRDYAKKGKRKIEKPEIL